MTAPPASGAASRAAPIDCETAVRRLWDYLDGRLPATAHDEVEAHLEACEVCPPHFAFARSLQRALAASADQPTGDASESRLRERVRAALRHQARAESAWDDRPGRPPVA